MLQLIRVFINALRRKSPPAATIKKTDICPIMLYASDPFQWLHKHDRNWFLEQFLNLVANTNEPTELNKTEIQYCIKSSAAHIKFKYKQAIDAGADPLTWYTVLDLLSAAYCMPLLPGMPSEDVKEIAELILSGAIDNDNNRSYLQ